MTDSATGGYLLPATTPAPDQGQSLNRVIQPWIVGVSGLPGDMVRPAFQSEPPDIPDAGEVWASFRYTTRPSDTFPYVRHDPSGYDELQRHEYLETLISFYDLGTNGLADQYAAIFRDGIAIEQNLELLGLQGIKLSHSGEETAVPVLFKNRWMYRVDIPVTLRRQINRVYNVLDVLSLTGTLLNDVGLPARDISVPNP